MQNDVKDNIFSDTAVITYINELQLKHERQVKTILAQQEQRYETLKLEYDELKERYDLLLYKRFGRSAEHLLADKKQPLLFSEEPEQPETGREEEEPELQNVRPFTRKKAGRKPLDENLPRREKVLDISDDDKICACGAELSRIGEETSEKLEIIPPVIYVEKTVRPKYACRSCEGADDEGKPAVRIAPVEPTMIPRSIAGASLLSTILTQKFELHLPYYRQEKQFKTIGAVISRQDMSNWQHQVYEKLSPLLALLKDTVKSGPWMQMDETTVQVLGEEDRENTQKSYMWLARGGPPGKTVIWYEYHPTRAALHAKAFLEGFRGHLQTDGYNGYDTAVGGNPGIRQVGCFAHARRNFFEAAKASKKPQSAEEGIKYIRRLYEVESRLRSFYFPEGIHTEETQAGQKEQFLEERKAEAGAVLSEFLAWLIKRREKLLPSSLLGKAVEYMFSQWDKLVAYLESPYLTPDNNACENAIRPFVIGRKNWLFCQSVDGAKSSCAMYSLIETAKQAGHIPYTYLRTLFDKAPFAVTPKDWELLLPWNISQNNP